MKQWTSKWGQVNPSPRPAHRLGYQFQQINPLRGDEADDGVGRERPIVVKG